MKGAGIVGASTPLQQLFAISTSNLNEETKKLQEVLASRTALLVYLQGIFGCIPWSILSVFMTDYLSSDLGMNMHRSTLAMLVFGVGAMVGQIAVVSGYRCFSTKIPSIRC